MWEEDALSKVLIHSPDLKIKYQELPTDNGSRIYIDKYFKNCRKTLDRRKFKFQ